MESLMSQTLKTYKNRPKQKEIAEALGVTEGAVSHVINDRRQSPTLRARIEKFIKQYQAA
jgi:DNA-binding LacI/PurR family transcriptional regulator